MASIDTIGYIGAVLLAICGVPEVVRTIKTGKTHIGWGMLLTWYIGEICFAIFAFYNFLSLQAVINYGINILAISVLIIYKLRKPRV